MTAEHETNPASAPRAATAADRYDQVLGLLTELRKDVAALDAKADELMGDSLVNVRKTKELSNLLMAAIAFFTFLAVLYGYFLYHESNRLEDILTEQQEMQSLGN